MDLLLLTQQLIKNLNSLLVEHPITIGETTIDTFGLLVNHFSVNPATRAELVFDVLQLISTYSPETIPAVPTKAV